MSTTARVTAMALMAIACACSRPRDPDLRPEPDVGPVEARDASPSPPAPSPPPTHDDNPWTLDHDFTLPKGAELSVLHGIAVTHDAVFTIEEGVTVKFGAGSALRVDGGTIVARGTASAPIVFTSSESPKHDGDWIGVVMNDPTSKGSVLDHVVIEYAGKGPNPGALKIVGGTPLSIGALSMVHDDGAGLVLVPLPPP